MYILICIHIRGLIRAFTYKGDFVERHTGCGLAGLTMAVSQWKVQESRSSPVLQTAHLSWSSVYTGIPKNGCSASEGVDLVESKQGGPASLHVLYLGRQQKV